MKKSLVFNPLVLKDPLLAKHKTRLLKTRSITIPRGMVRWGDELKSEHISRSSQLGELRFQFTANHGGGKR